MKLSRAAAAPQLYYRPGGPDPRALRDHEDVEVLLEAYEQEFAATATRLELMRAEIENAEDLYRFWLDAARNRIITADALFTLVGTTIAACAAVASFFGMNLENHLEDDARAFRHVIFFTCAGCGAGFVGALTYMSCTGMIVS